MTPFERAYVSKEHVEQQIATMFQQWKDGSKVLRDFIKTDDQNHARLAIHEFLRKRHEEDSVIFKNDTYQVVVTKRGEWVHLSIKRNDKQPVHIWRDLQEIKNQLVGEECEALELYPAESRKVDTACQYHLWCHNDPTFRFGIGFNDGRIVSDESIAGSTNNPITDLDLERNKRIKP